MFSLTFFPDYTRLFLTRNLNTLFFLCGIILEKKGCEYYIYRNVLSLCVEAPNFNYMKYFFK